ncbi:hypothetical protein ACJ72_01802 [Emergomyces africanus]|uniref:Uncharacterized protein n=1 Tax=Emergomyces africanus TaxID=1955775 RepID=A0A1B7P494_9EURO|nr:hypothetical protein ACJ72_01802 [Emergomyces africanus]
MDHLKQMQFQTNSNGVSRLVAMVHEFSHDETYHLNIIDAGKHSNQWVTLKEIYRVSIAAAKNSWSKNILRSLRRWYGVALQKFPESENDRKEALTIWEENVGLSLTSTEPFLGFVDGPSAGYLASIYLGGAKQGGFDDHATEHYLPRLQSVCELWSERSPCFERLILGRFYSLMGKRDKALDAVKWVVKFGIDLLCDEDLANDWEGYFKLASSLHFVDDVNCLAAWSLLGPQVEENEGQDQRDVVRGQEDEEGQTPEQDAPNAAKLCPGAEGEIASDGRPREATGNTMLNGGEGKAEETDTKELQCSEEASDTFTDTEDNREPAPPDGEAESRAPYPAPSPISDIGGMYILCCGERGCNRLWTFADDIYVCKDCAGVYLCKGCLEKLQAGTLQEICSEMSVVCKKSHEFFHVPSWNYEEARRIPNGHVKVGREVITLSNWLDNMRRKYGLTVEGKTEEGV